MRIKNKAENMNALAHRAQTARTLRESKIGYFKKLRIIKDANKAIKVTARNGYLTQTIYVDSEMVGTFLRNYLRSKGFDSEYWVHHPKKVEVTISWKRKGDKYI